MIHAWDNYPIDQFPAVWEWVAEHLAAHTLVMPRVAFEEVTHLASDCSQWLEDHGLELIEINNEIAQDAVRIKGLLGIVNDRYHPNGVWENDLLIIACARARSWDLISDEAKQAQAPTNPARRKIPSVCSMADVNVNCMSFIEHLKDSRQVFR